MKKGKKKATKRKNDIVEESRGNPIITETTASAVGLIVLFAFILCAVPIYIYCGFKNEPYAFLDKNIPFELEYGVKGMVTERKRKFRDTYIKFNIIAACVCIFLRFR